MLLQFLLVAFAIFAISRVVQKARQGLLSRGEAAAWGLLWLALGVAGALPQTTSLLANAFGIGRGVDLAVYLSIIALFYALFRVMVRLDQQRQQLTELTRQLALREPMRPSEELKMKSEKFKSPQAVSGGDGQPSSPPLIKGD